MLLLTCVLGLVLTELLLSVTMYETISHDCLSDLRFKSSLREGAACCSKVIQLISLGSFFLIEARSRLSHCCVKFFWHPKNAAIIIEEEFSLPCLAINRQMSVDQDAKFSLLLSPYACIRVPPYACHNFHMHVTKNLKKQTEAFVLFIA